MLLFIAKMWISPKSLSEIRKKSLTYPQELHFYTLPSYFQRLLFPHFSIKEKKKLRFFYFFHFKNKSSIFLDLFIVLLPLFEQI